MLELVYFVVLAVFSQLFLTVLVALVAYEESQFLLGTWKVYFPAQQVLVKNQLALPPLKCLKIQISLMI